jgi:glycogen synthase
VVLATQMEVVDAALRAKESRGCLGGRRETSGGAMRVLMLGWEFPPFISGGLGTACQGLTAALARLGTEILFVLPTGVRAEQSDPPRLAAASVSKERHAANPGSDRAVAFVDVPSTIRSPYLAAGTARTTDAEDLAAQRGAPGQAHRPEEAGLRVIGTGAAGGYEGNLIGRIQEYADRCLEMVRGEPYDVIHAHDWVTFPAGIAIAALTGKRLIVHVHSTEFDRSGELVNQAVYDIERRGMHAASKVICVSHLTRSIVVRRYSVPPEKVEVIHNGIAQNGTAVEAPRVHRGQQIVLFLGRITMQKGPEFFIRAAARVLEKLDNVMFVVAGSGDRLPQMVEDVARRGLGSSVLFAGFLRGADVERAYRMADVYVMPSVSEPFGLTALEAIRCGVPTIVSKTSGVAEVLQSSVLKVDFWDVDRMAGTIIALLTRPEIGQSLRRHAAAELRGLTWESSARRCLDVYGKLL